MSKLIDTDFSAQERALLLAEIRTYLPAFLQRGAAEQHDPVGDVKELLDLDAADIDRILSVHACLTTEAIAFGSALKRGVRNPSNSSNRPPAVSQSVRGPVDWGATLRERASRGGDPTVFVVRSAERIYNTPENRALRWAIAELRARVARSGFHLPEDPSRVPDVAARDDGWADRIELLSRQLDDALRAPWLRDLKAEEPNAQTLRAIRASRTEFYAHTLFDAIEMILAATDPSSKGLSELLCKRYFEPAESWRIFEVVVALRLARALRQSLGLRKARLLVGAGATPFARYERQDGDEVRLFYQRWPHALGPSKRNVTARRHGFSASTSRPDIFIDRSGSSTDRVVLELKATRSASYLSDGLSQLLGYLGDRPDVWGENPSGWLVAPKSDSFMPSPPDHDNPLWVIDADNVATAVVARFAGS